MKRFGGLFDEIAAYGNLVAAARRAARGKRSSAAVALFLRDLEPEVLALERELTAGTYRPGRYRTFIITDPKQRQITVAPFRDRVLHHAVSGVVEPYFERLFIHDSYACRRGKGTLRAVARAQHFCRRSDYFLKLDVRSFFHSIRHDGYLRYMDDLVLFGRDKATLWTSGGLVSDFLAQRLQLALKDSATLLAPVTQGLPFLGRRVYPNLVRIRRQNLRRSMQRWQRRRARAVAGDQMRQPLLAHSASAIFAHLAQADSLRLRQDIVAQLGGDCGQTPGPGANRVIRGGSWNNNARNCRSANRNNNNPDNENNNNGFRPVNSWQGLETGVQGRRSSAQGHDQAICPVPRRQVPDEEVGDRGGW